MPNDVNRFACLTCLYGSVKRIADLARIESDDFLATPSKSGLQVVQADVASAIT
jgi:hypothetical protein